MRQEDREKLIQIHTTLHGVEGKGGMVDLLKDHEKRIRKNERLMIGAQAAWAAVAGWLFYLKRGG